MTNEEFNERFKPGDIITNGSWIFIFDSTRTGRLFPERHAIVYRALMNLSDDWLMIHTRTGIGYVNDRSVEDTRLSSNEEIDHLFKVMRLADAYWDSENKVIRHISNGNVYCEEFDNLYASRF